MTLEELEEAKGDCLQTNKIKRHFVQTCQGKANYDVDRRNNEVGVAQGLDGRQFVVEVLDEACVAQSSEIHERLCVEVFGRGADDSSIPTQRAFD